MLPAGVRSYLQRRKHGLKFDECEGGGDVGAAPASPAAPAVAAGVLVCCHVLPEHVYQTDLAPKKNVHNKLPKLEQISYIAQADTERHRETQRDTETHTERRREKHMTRNREC